MDRICKLNVHFGCFIINHLRKCNLLERANNLVFTVYYSRSGVLYTSNVAGIGPRALAEFALGYTISKL